MPYYYLWFWRIFSSPRRPRGVELYAIEIGRKMPRNVRKCGEESVQAA
jgi:hypothetical protein